MRRRNFFFSYSVSVSKSRQGRIKKGESQMEGKKGKKGGKTGNTAALPFLRPWACLHRNEKGEKKGSRGKSWEKKKRKRGGGGLFSSPNSPTLFINSSRWYSAGGGGKGKNQGKEGREKGRPILIQFHLMHE